MDKKIMNVSSNPHVRSEVSTQGIMFDVLIALVPAAFFGVFNFGLRALLLIATCMITCILSEFVFERLTKRKNTILDLSAAVTGLLLALNLPAEFPVWMAVIGSVFAIIVVKQLFGGIGQNFMNPALAARCFLLLSFGTRMTTFVYDGVTSATPLAVIKNGGTYELKAMFLGTTGGTIGETCVPAILAGALFLLFRRVISLRIPLTYILTFVVFMVLFTDIKFDYVTIACELCGGGLMLGAFFMATDYVTSPITPAGKIWYGIILGLLTGLFRFYGPNAEGVSYAIIIGNLLVPIIEKFTVPYAFGREKERFFGRLFAKRKKDKEVKV